MPSWSWNRQPQATGRAPRPREPALTGISRARWSAGGCQLPAPPLAAARGTESRPGPPRASSCGPPPPGWTPGPLAMPAPTWQLGPAGVGGHGPGAAPRWSSSAGSQGSGGGGGPPPGVRGRGESGWWEARVEAGGQGGAGGTGSGWSGVVRDGDPPLPPEGSAPGGRMGWGRCSLPLQLREQEVQRGQPLSPSLPANLASRILAPFDPEI